MSDTENTSVHTRTSDKVQRWADDAVADGWMEKPGGPHGRQQHPLTHDPVFGQFTHTGERRTGDRSRELIQDDKMVLIVDRDNAPVMINGWFDFGHSAWESVPEVYDHDAIESLRTRCHVCQQPSTTLRHISFAGKVCPQCDTSTLRNEMEFPGWTY